MKIGRFFKKILSGDSLAGLSVLALVSPQIVGHGERVGEAAQAGLEAIAQAPEMPLWQRVLVGVLAAGAVYQRSQAAHEEAE